MSTLTLTQPGGRTQIDKWLAEARAAGTTDRYAGKRRHPRTTWSAKLQVRVPVTRSRAETYYATALDISEGGIGFFCRAPIPCFTPIEIFLDGQLTGIAAVVMHCAVSLGGYRIGAEFRSEPQRQAAPAISRAG